jgi:hypothetical protein
MSPILHPHRLLSTRVAACVAVALLMFGTVACTDDGPGESAPTSTTGPAPPAGPSATPKASLVAAVEALLDAEQSGAHAASYAVLSSASRKQIGDRADWADLRSELPAITGFEVVAGKKDGEVVATVSHEPGLDPFVGLSPARERQTWRGARAGDGWLVDGAPTIVPELPSDAGAAEVARNWAQAVQSCDEALARLGQALDEIHGISSGAAELCGSEGAVTVGEVGPLESGPTSAELVAQYTDAALEWARVVPVEGPVPPFLVVLAPIGDEWRVVGVSD